MLRFRVAVPFLLALAANAHATDVSGTITTTTRTKANSPYRVTGTDGSEGGMGNPAAIPSQSMYLPDTSAEAGTAVTIPVRGTVQTAYSAEIVFTVNSAYLSASSSFVVSHAFESKQSPEISWSMHGDTVFVALSAAEPITLSDQPLVSVRFVLNSQTPDATIIPLSWVPSLTFYNEAPVENLTTGSLTATAREGNVSGSITTQTWTKVNSPYRATGNITVPAGNTLTIEPGVDVVLDSAVSFVVGGTLRAIGTPQDSIRFLKSGESYWGGMTFTGTGNLLECVRVSGGDKVGGYGGGLYASGSTVIRNSVISGNQAAYGGGVASGALTVRLEDCTISGNYAPVSGGGVCGTVTMVGCTISDNWGRAGGGVAGRGNTMQMEDCIVSGNGGYLGGGGFFHGGSKVKMVRCTIFNNSSGDQGGAFYFLNVIVSVRPPLSDVPDVTLTNCTIVGNTALQGNAFAYGNVRLAVKNCIIWGHASGYWPTATYSDIQESVSGVGNINSDPLFVDAANGNFRLQPGSPANGMGAFPWPVGVVEQQRLPAFSLLQNAPNPFNPSTTIRFTLPEASPVSLVVYDVTGALVRTLADGTYQPGAHAVVWNGLDRSGRACASGVYVYRLIAKQGVVTRRMTLLR